MKIWNPIKKGGKQKGWKGSLYNTAAPLTGNSIGDEGAKELASRLPQCTALQHLDLRGKAGPMKHRCGVPVISGRRKKG
eukprot:scaffold152589_cov44-Prasinocladus_malaysianus.AAC.3